ncbi:glycosyltransferase family 2 protein [Stenotrophomonas sp. UBA7606]|uniref:glycosyltransferase family 2 protein n=1 Tax=Stenotrophomonas sp. UBA7606 TaxID=1947559 RepID=UPI0025F1345F|nr:glycosyltransferase family A protein [Stenotrophomonas sp. UBA7606]
MIKKETTTALGTGSGALKAPDVALGPRPLVSVVMTSFNTSTFVEAAATSILRQTWDNLELLAIDDQSTDDTLRVLLNLQRKDPRVRVLLMNQNSGTYAARNAAMEHAKGEVITFIDSDDQAHEDRLYQQLEALRSPAIVASTCNYERRNEHGQLVMNRGLPARQALISLMFKRTALDEIGWFDNVRFGADDEFFERLRSVYGRAAHTNVDATLYTALWRQGSLANNATDGTFISQDGPEFLSPVRQRYKSAFTQWHQANKSKNIIPYIPHRPQGRAFNY